MQSLKNLDLLKTIAAPSEKENGAKTKVQPNLAELPRRARHWETKHISPMEQLERWSKSALSRVPDPLTRHQELRLDAIQLIALMILRPKLSLSLLLTAWLIL
ncbi:Hypothetical predicted protein, partial [Pelobates cultripes]